MKANAQTASIEIAGVSSYPNVDVASDENNLHEYLSASGGVKQAMAASLAAQTAVSPGKGFAITEMGWSTDPNTSNGVVQGIDEITQAKLTLDAYLDAASLGATQVGLYELRDWNFTDYGAYYGLFHTDGTPKIAATALHNMQAILSDTGATASSFAPASLNYAVSGATDVNTLLTEKSDGTFVIALWREPTIWNAATGTEVAVSNETITVSLDGSSVISSYSPIDGAGVLSTSTATSVAVTLSDKPIFLMIAPAPAVTPSPAAVSGAASPSQPSTGAAAVAAGTFDALEYAASNPDVALAYGTNIAALNQHYLDFGIGEGRQVASFDALEYAASNPDVALAYGTDRTLLETHYIDFGIKEGRAVASFDALEYAASNPDVALAYGTDRTLLETHYIDFGIKEGRAVASFDALEYAASNRDVALAYGTDRAALETHYVDFGIKEGRSVTSFDALEYAASNPDVALAYGANQAALETHYITYGINEGRQVASFDVSAYAAANPDLAARYGNNRTALLTEYVTEGVVEGRPLTAAAASTALFDTGSGHVNGTSASETLFASLGSTLTGGGGTDRFEVGQGMGKVTITDFGGKDTLDLNPFVHAGLSPTITLSGLNTVIGFGTGDSVTLLGVTPSHLTQSGGSFTFH